MSVQTEIPRNKATIVASQEPVVDVPEASSDDLSVDVAELGAMVLGPVGPRLEHGPGRSVKIPRCGKSRGNPLQNTGKGCWIN